MKKNTLLVLSALVGILVGCQNIERNSTDPRPQINFSGAQISYAIPDVGKSIKIPIKLESAPTSEIGVTCELTGPLGKDEYKVTPEVVTFTPTKTSDTVYVTNLSHQKSNIEMLLSILKVPDGYREGLINYVTIEFGGSPIALFSGRQLTMNRTGIAEIVLKDINGKWFYSPGETEIQVKVDTERSTAIEGEHFKLNPGNTVTVKKRNKSATLNVERLKYDPNHNKICLEIVPRSGVAVDEVDSKCVLTIEPQDMSGTWKYKSFSNKSDFDWFETAPAIEGQEDDAIVITKRDDATYDIDFQINGTLRHYFTKDTPAVFKREFINDGGMGEHITEFTLEGINENISPNFQSIRSGVVGFGLGKQEDGKRVLTVYVYDMMPKEYFRGTYDIMADGVTEFPILGFAPRYIFVEE